MRSNEIELIDFYANVYVAVLLFATTVAIMRFIKVDKPTKFLCLWVFLGGTTEITAKFCVNYFGTNLPVYTIYSFVEITLIAMYFNFSVNYIREYRIGWYVVFGGFLLWCVNTIWLQPLNSINSNFIFFECLTIVCLGLYSIYRRLIIYNKSLIPKTHFWIPCILIFYQCGVLWNWGAYDYFLNQYPEKTYILIISILVINTLVYLALTVILLLYPKMKRTYVS